MSPPASAARVVLHVGLPKCGSSYIQSALGGLSSSASLVAVRDKPVYRAAKELLGEPRGNQAHPGKQPDRWSALAAKVRARAGTSVISSELLAYVDQQRATLAIEAFGDAEVHVVVVARDLASLLPSRWQQNLKTGRDETFADYLDSALGGDANHGSLNPALVCRTWGAALPPERVHLVTMPPSGAPHDELWRRFCAAAGITFQEVPAPPDRVNTSMGIVSAELVRRLNGRLDRAADPQSYGRMVKRILVNRILTADDSPRATLPDPLLPRTAAITERWCTELSQVGYPVHGSLEDLRPQPRAGGDPAAVTEAEVLDVAVSAVAALIAENDAQARTIRSLRREVTADQHSEEGTKSRLSRLLRRPGSST